MLDLDIISHNCCPWPKSVSGLWPKVIPPRSRSQCTHTQITCPGHNSSLQCWIWIIFRTIVVLDTRVFRDLNIRSYLEGQEKKKEIWPSPMTKPPIPTENSKTKGQHTQTPPKTSITQRLRTDLGRSVGVISNPTGVVKPVYGIPTFPLTAKAV